MLPNDDFDKIGEVMTIYSTTVEKARELLEVLPEPPEFFPFIFVNRIRDAELYRAAYGKLKKAVEESDEDLDMALSIDFTVAERATLAAVCKYTGLDYRLADDFITLALGDFIDTWQKVLLCYLQASSPMVQTWALDLIDLRVKHLKEKYLPKN